MMAVSIDTASGFRAGNPLKLFSGPYYTALSGRSFDISPDGQHFVMVKAVASVSSSAWRLVVVENWLEELKRLVPTK
jgi:hypothetical protein